MFTTPIKQTVSTPSHTIVDLVDKVVYHDCTPTRNSRKYREVVSGYLDEGHALVVLSEEKFDTKDMLRVLLDPNVRHVRDGEACDSFDDVLSFHDAMRFVAQERVYQIGKYGIDKQQSLPGFFTIIRKELMEAEAAWFRSTPSGRESPLAGITQVAASAVACIQKYGATGCTVSTNDAAPDGHFDPDAL